MQIVIRRIIPRLMALAAAGLVLPQLAAAQTAVTSGAASSLIRPREQHTRKIAPPPALPGARSRTGSAAPPSQVPTDMSPNDALFDAINRGDVAAARDALSRGAQLDAHNVLGLTPIELAVDLGHNDIAFLLLSMRGASGPDSAGPPSGQATQAAAKTPAPRPPRHMRKTAERKPAKVTPPAPPEQPRLFANDGGTPIPGIGFLGFGSQRGTP